MKFLAKIEKGKLDFWNKKQFEDHLFSLEGEVDVIVEKHQDTRSLQQNKALHLWFQLLADEMNDAGYDMKKVIKEEIDIPWTSYTVKEYLWRPVQKTYLGKESTTKLETKEIDKIYDILNKVIGERTGIHVPFPSRLDIDN